MEINNGEKAYINTENFCISMENINGEIIQCNVLCIKCNEMFYYYTMDTDYLPKICPFCKSKEKNK